MRLSLIAMVLALAAIVGTASAEANPYYGDNNDGRIERSHSNWSRQAAIFKSPIFAAPVLKS